MTQTISPAELAKVLKVSRQSVYNRMTKDLSKFVKEIDGKKRLDIAVLEYLGVNEVDEKPSTNLDEVVKALTHELEVKNEQIKAMTAQISALTNQNAELTNALQNTTQSLMAAQALHASSVKQLTDGSEKKESWWQRHRKKKETVKS